MPDPVQLEQPFNPNLDTDPANPEGPGVTPPDPTPPPKDYEKPPESHNEAPGQGYGKWFEYGQKLVERADQNQQEHLRQMSETSAQVNKMLQETIRQEQELSQNYQSRQQSQQIPVAPSEQERRKQLGMSALGYLAVALPLAALMGSKGGFWASAAWGGLGRGLQALAEGNQAQAEQGISLWHKQSELMQQKAHDELQNYKAVLAEKSLTMNQMMDSINLLAKVYGDKELEDKAELKQWGAMTKQLVDFQKALNEHDKVVQGVKKKANELMGGKMYEHQSDYIAKFRQDHGFDPFDTNLTEEQKKIVRKDSFSKFLDLHTGKPTEKEKEDAEKADLPDEEERAKMRSHVLD